MRYLNASSSRGAVGEDEPNKWERLSRLAGQLKGTITVLDIRGMNNNAQRETQHVDHGACFTSLLLADRQVKCMMNTLKRAVPIPEFEIVVHWALRQVPR